MAAQAARRAEEVAAAALSAAAVEWAAMHEPTGGGDAAYWWEAGQPIPLAGEGAPEIAEYAVAGFAAAVGLTTDSGRRLDSTPRRPVTLYLHLSEQALAGGSQVGRCENTRTPVSVDAIRAWCGHPDAAVTVKPVVDLAAHVRVDQYELPDRLRDVIDQSVGHCVFGAADPPEGATTTTPSPTTQAGLRARATWRRCADITTDSRITRRGATRSPSRGVHAWTSPHGYDFLVDPTGTRM